MDSLLANYASEEEEEEEEEEAEVDKKQFPATSRAISLSLPNPSFDSNPHPKTSLFSSLPPPKSEEVDKKNVSPPPRSISLSLPSFDSNQHPKMSLFSSHPPPKSEEVDKKDVSRPSRPVSLSLPNPSFDSNPNPKTSFFSSLPSPKSFTSSSSSSSSSSSFFPSLPPPKSHQSIPPKPIITPSPNPNPKKVIQFKPPFNPSLLDDDDDDDEDKQEKERKPSKETSSSISKALSSILPPPKNSLAFAPSRKSVIGSDVPATSTNESRQEPPKDVGCDNRVNYETNWISSDNHVNYQSDWVSSTTPMDAPSNESYSSDVNYGGDWVDGSSTAAMETATNIPSNENYGDYASYGNYESTWMDGSSATMASEMARMNESAGRLMRKRGRNEIPSDIVEVKQDELISNRPREDQVKLTGIAFGPSYQPVSSVKGKPSKLHKRKHQIGSLFHDMKQKEMELAERRAKGFLTKAETQAKYGW